MSQLESMVKTLQEDLKRVSFSGFDSFLSLEEKNPKLDYVCHECLLSPTGEGCQGDATGAD